MMAAAICALFLTAATSDAALLISLTPNPVEGGAGDIVDINFDITNTFGAAFTIEAVSASNIDGTVGDFDSFFGEAVGLSFGPGGSATGLLGSFLFSATSAPGASGSMLVTIAGAVEGGDRFSYGQNVTYSVSDGTTPPVPEPTGLVLLGLVLAGTAAARRRS